MVEPLTTAALIALMTAASAGGGALATVGGNKETKTQRQQRKLIDDLLASLGGGGSFGDLFSTDEAAFQKSFVDPAKSIFQNQIAPGIQQQFIASGQQKGTGLDDQLLRAGVDLDQLLNSQFADFQQQGQNRKSNAISSILGAGAGAPNALTGGQGAAQGGAGLLSNDNFFKFLTSIGQGSGQEASVGSTGSGGRKGFTNDPFSLPNFDPSSSQRGF